MEQFNDFVERYLAVWNETDAAQRQALLAQVWTADASYVDPLMRGAGHAEIGTLVQGVQARFGGYRFRRTGVVDGYGSYVRFSWELGPSDQAAPIAGSDVAILAADGRVQQVIGFLDRVPEAAAST